MSLRQRLMVRNHRGSLVPAIFALPLLAGGAVGVAWAAATGSIGSAGTIASASAFLVAIAGLVDDLAPPGPRGLRAHLRALVEGHVSTGVVKLVVIVAASLITVAASERTGGATRIFGVLLIAGSTNLWNGLDVRPGRALKWFLLLAVTTVVWTPIQAPFVPGVAVVSALTLWPDLRERAMLGDAGANLLGFTAGVALYLRTSAAWIPLAAVVVVALNVLAETVSLSRTIGSMAPLRWFDGVGTIRPEGEETDR